ncbi:MAG: glycosyltransferase family 9 protein [bacterium]
MLKQIEQVNNILCFRNDRFGEFLLNIPAFGALKKSYPGSKLTLIVDPYVRELAGCIDCVDDIILWENKKHSVFEIIRLSSRLKAKKFSLSVAFNPSKEFNIASFLSGIPLRLGYDHKLGFLLTHRLKDKKYLGERHEIEYNLELAGLAGAITEDKELSLPIDSHLADDLFKDLSLGSSDNLLALHPWTSDPLKQWPVDSFSSLAGQLLSDKRLSIVVIGGREEYPKSLEFCRGLKVNNLVGKTSLVQLAALLKRSRLLISGDSGPIHLAACVGTPVIAIFRNDLPGKSPRRWGPWGQGHIVIEKNNLREISVEEVLNKAREKLKSL